MSLPPWAGGHERKDSGMLVTRQGAGTSKWAAGAQQGTLATLQEAQPPGHGQESWSEHGQLCSEEESCSAPIVTTGFTAARGVCLARQCLQPGGANAASLSGAAPAVAWQEMPPDGAWARMLTGPLASTNIARLK
jgi:hypothetical protein